MRSDVDGGATYDDERSGWRRHRSFERLRRRLTMSPLPLARSPVGQRERPNRTGRNEGDICEIYCKRSLGQPALFR